MYILNWTRCINTSWICVLSVWSTLRRKSFSDKVFAALQSPRYHKITLIQFYDQRWSDHLGLCCQHMIPSPGWGETWTDSLCYDIYLLDISPNISHLRHYPFNPTFHIIKHYFWYGWQMSKGVMFWRRCPWGWRYILKLSQSEIVSIFFYGDDNLLKISSGFWKLPSVPNNVVSVLWNHMPGHTHCIPLIKWYHV